MGNKESKRNSTRHQECQDTSAKGCQSLVRVGPVQETAGSDGYSTEAVHENQFEALQRASSVMETSGSCTQASVEPGELVLSFSTAVKSLEEHTPIPVSAVSSHEHSQSEFVTGALKYTITPCSRWERNTNITHTTGVSTSPDTSVYSSYQDEIVLMNNKEPYTQTKTRQHNLKSVIYEQRQILESEKQRLKYIEKTERLPSVIKHKSNFESNENVTINKISHKTDYTVASQKVSQEVDGGTMAGGQTTSSRKKKRNRRSCKSRAILPCTLQQGAFTSGSGQHGQHRQQNKRPRRRQKAGRRKKAPHKQESLTRGELMVHVSESSQSSSSSSSDCSDGEPTHNLTKQLNVSVPPSLQPSSGHTDTRKGAQEEGILLKTTTSNLKPTPSLTVVTEPQRFSSPLENHMPGNTFDSGQNNVDNLEDRVGLKPDTELTMQQKECVSSEQTTQSLPTTDGSESPAELLSQLGQVESTNTVLISSEDSSFETSQQIFPAPVQSEAVGDPDENPGHSHPSPILSQDLLSNDPKQFVELYRPDPGGGVVHTPPINSLASLVLPVPSEISCIKIGSGGGKKLESWLREPASPKEVNNLCIGMVQFKRAQADVFGFKSNAIWRIGIDDDRNAHIPDKILEANVPVALFLSTLIDIVAFYLVLPTVQKDHCLKHDINSHKLSVFIKTCGSGTVQTAWTMCYCSWEQSSASHAVCKNCRKR